MNATDDFNNSLKGANVKELQKRSLDEKEIAIDFSCNSVYGRDVCASYQGLSSGNLRADDGGRHGKKEHDKKSTTKKSTKQKKSKKPSSTEKTKSKKTQEQQA